MFNKISHAARQGFQLGRQAIRRAPTVLGQVLDYGNKVASTAKQVGDTANKLRDVYNRSAQAIKPSDRLNAGIQKTFDTVSAGVKRIDTANQALQTVGGNVRTLF